MIQETKRANNHAVNTVDLTKKFGDFTAVDAINFTVRRGEIFGFLGPNGAGKTTTMRMIMGLLPPTSGEVTVLGFDSQKQKSEIHQRIGYMSQRFSLYNDLTVAENLAFGLPPALRGRALRQSRVKAALAQAGLRDFSGRDPATLSGGQRARVALMRTLLSEPRALLLDEPFAKLDVALRARLRDFVFEHARGYGLPTLLVTHDPADAEAADGPVVTVVPPGGENPGQEVSVQEMPGQVRLREV